MCIDVCRGGEGTVPQPDLDLLHGDTAAEKQAGAGVTKIMEANLAKSIPFSKKVSNSPLALDFKGT